MPSGCARSTRRPSGTTATTSPTTSTSTRPTATSRLRRARRRRQRATALRVLLDIVPNHCSDQHPWFQAALRRRARQRRAGPLLVPRPAARAGRRTTGRPRSAARCGPPSAATTRSGTSARSRRYQPDFDHRHPAVDAMFADTLRFWFDRGVEGFRVDAVWPGRQGPGPARLPAAGAGRVQPGTPVPGRGPRRVAALAEGRRRLHRPSIPVAT